MSEATPEVEEQRHSRWETIKVILLSLVAAAMIPLLLWYNGNEDGFRQARSESVEKTYGVTVLSYDEHLTSMVLEKDGKALKCAFPSQESVIKKTPLTNCAETIIVKAK